MKRLRAAILATVLSLSSSAFAQAVRVGDCDPSPQSYVVIKPAKKPGDSARGRPIIAGSQDACAEIVDPNARYVDSIQLDLTLGGNGPDSGPTRPDRPHWRSNGARPLTNPMAPD